MSDKNVILNWDDANDDVSWDAKISYSVQCDAFEIQ